MGDDGTIIGWDDEKTTADGSFYDNTDLSIDLGAGTGSAGSPDAGSGWGSDPAQVQAINDQNAQARAEAIAGGLSQDDANIMYPDVDPGNPYAIN